MAPQLVPPPPLDSGLAKEVGPPGVTWSKWFQTLWDKLHGGWTAAKVIVATSTSSTDDFASLAEGDTVLVMPSSAGDSHFVTVAAAGTLPEAAVVGSVYVALRGF